MILCAVGSRASLTKMAVRNVAPRNQVKVTGQKEEDLLIPRLHGHILAEQLVYINNS